VLTRNEVEPYGQLINHTITEAVGFTGHVQDALTGLTYMQQRYYDPMIGRFLSVDPVTATSVGGNFNRYWYGNDNPYRFMDPNGRLSKDRVWKGRSWDSLKAHSSNGQTAPARQLTAQDVVVVSDRNSVTGETTPVQEGQAQPGQEAIAGLVGAINEAGEVLESSSAKEELGNFNVMKVFLTLADHGDDFAYATAMPNGDLVMTINYPRAMGKLNFAERVGKFLHEVRHFSRENILKKQAWIRDTGGADMPTSAYHEKDAYDFQQSLVSKQCKSLIFISTYAQHYFWPRSMSR
jgi:RHS repeat-associated protein